MSEVQSGTSKNGYEWQRMTLTLEIPGFQGSVTKQVFQVSGDDVNDVLLYSIGDKVEVSWSMYAREWNGTWYNNVDRVKKAREHLKAATTLLNNIKWENIDGMEDLLMIQSKTSISDADRSLDHITKIQDTEK